MHKIEIVQVVDVNKNFVGLQAINYFVAYIPYLMKRSFAGRGYRK
jgi:hypothetical protein